ncbi:MAG: thiamine phosphate synthase [Bacilli bacterium]
MSRRTLHWICDERENETTFAKIAASIQEEVDWFHVRVAIHAEKKAVLFVEALLQQEIAKEKIILHNFNRLCDFYQIGGIQWSEYAEVEQTSCEIVSHAVHSAAALKKYDNLEVAWLMCGHVYETASKEGQRGRGLPWLEHMRSNTAHHLVAIGGIDEHNIYDVLQTGVEGVAVLSHFYKSGNVESAKMMRKALDEEVSKSCQM